MTPVQTGSTDLLVNVDNTVHVRRGDVIGIRWNQDDPVVPYKSLGVVPCTDGANTLYGSNPNPEYGEILEMENDTGNCKQYSVRAHIEPRPSMLCMLATKTCYDYTHTHANYLAAYPQTCEYHLQKIISGLKSITCLCLL